MPLDVHVVTHTHWDREWYHPAGRFRQRLVALIDELLDAPPGTEESFLLDGQAIVVEDYLAVRPERRQSLAALLQGGRIEAGPWYVLADELIPSGEALIRNLLAGKRALAALGAESPPVLYCPDSFGHPAALPELAAGFGLPLIIAWRGLGGRRWPSGDLFEWRAPSGASEFLFHLARDGYELGSSLPTDEERAAERWRRLRGELASRSTTGVLLVQNGADHHARQRGLETALQALARAAQPDLAHASSLTRFAGALAAKAGAARPPRIEGELRDSYGYTWALQGTLATRAAQKRANATVERALLREAEPWAALAWWRGGTPRGALLDAAWKTLLHAHPHDTLCGCSIDAVADAFDVRVASAAAQADGVRYDALLDLAHHDPVEARERKGHWRPVVIARNASARRRGGIAYVELEELIADVAVGPGSGSTPPPPTADAPRALRIDGATVVQPLSTARVHRRIESPRHYPDNGLVHVTRALAWFPELPGYGVRGFALHEGRSRGKLPERARARGTTIENGLLRLSVHEAGSVSLEQIATGERLDDLLVIEDRVDVGDTYTPAPRGAASRVEHTATRVRLRGPLRAEVEIRWRLRDARQRATSRLTVSLALDAGSPFVRVGIVGHNAADDHRLRIGFRTGIRATEHWADAAFGPVRRVPLEVPPEDSAAETPPPTAPLHRYVSVFDEQRGTTLYSDGLAEYEVAADGTVFVTAVRAVGQLSRNDVAERPGHAGWPAPTPGAQCHGPFAAQLALFPHEARTSDTVARIERVADDVLLPLTAFTLRSALRLPDAVAGVELDGAGLAVSAIKPSDDGRWLVLRCVNLLDRTVDGAWTLGVPLAEARASRLDETPGEARAIEGPTVRFTAAAREVVTTLVRCQP